MLLEITTTNFLPYEQDKLKSSSIVTKRSDFRYL